MRGRLVFHPGVLVEVFKRTSGGEETSALSLRKVRAVIQLTVGRKSLCDVE